ncbi:MAG: hypothetical protein Q7Q71_16670 [Verrucomicrobiota bacterium JB023]|nr:hypothetical protein [Verrucomicrobiota bacterium JB023]
MPESRISDYLSFLQELDARGLDYFLEGGQAVNFWAEYFSAKGADATLKPFQPFTSKDCDVWVSHAALNYLRTKENGGRLVEGSSPADGQVGIFSLNGSRSLVVDIMSNVYGVPVSKLPQLKKRSLTINGIRVIDPIFLFQSKCHCLRGLDQAGRQDEKHLRMLCLLLPEYLVELIEEARDGNITQRAVIKEVKLLQAILQRSNIKQALEEVEVIPVTLVPVEALRDSGLMTLVRFVDSEYPQED